MSNPRRTMNVPATARLPDARGGGLGLLALWSLLGATRGRARKKRAARPTTLASGQHASRPRRRASSGVPRRRLQPHRPVRRNRSWMKLNGRCFPARSSAPSPRWAAPRTRRCWRRSAVQARRLGLGSKAGTRDRHLRGRHRGHQELRRRRPQPRRQRQMNTAASRRPAVPRLVDDLRPGQREREPAGVVLAGLPRTRPAAAQLSTGWRPPATRVRGFRDGKRRCCTWSHRRPQSRRATAPKLDLSGKTAPTADASGTANWRPASPRHELAYKMQSAAPETEAISPGAEETKAVRVGRKVTGHGHNCLLASAGGPTCLRAAGTPAAAAVGRHSDVEGSHGKHCKETDQMDAGLLGDLKRRGQQTRRW